MVKEKLNIGNYVSLALCAMYLILIFGVLIPQCCEVKKQRDSLLKELKYERN